MQTMRDGDIPLEKLTGGSANWDRSQAAALMEQWIRQFGDAIEVVIGNNDEMALGAARRLNAPVTQGASRWSASTEPRRESRGLRAENCMEQSSVTATSMQK